MKDGLFIAIYLDEDVAVLVGELLLRRGFRTLTARDAGRLGKSDDEQLAFATERGMAILTHNRDDFEELHRQYIEAGQPHAGIVIANQPLPYELTQRLLRLLDMLTSDEMRNQLLYI